MITTATREELSFYPKLPDKALERFVLLRAWPKSGFDASVLLDYLRDLKGSWLTWIDRHYETEAQYRAHLAQLEAYEQTRPEAAKLRDHEAQSILAIRIAEKALALKSLEQSRAATSAVNQLADLATDFLRSKGAARVAAAVQYNPDTRALSRAKIEHIQAERATLKADEERARASLMPEAEAWARIRVDLEQARDRGSPKVTMRAGLAPSVAWPLTHADSIGRGAGANVLDAKAIACALHFDEIASHLRAQLGRDYERAKANGVAVMTAADKTAALNKVANDRHRVERLEAELVWREVEASGGIFPPWTRPDMQADHVLGIEF